MHHRFPDMQRATAAGADQHKNRVTKTADMTRHGSCREVPDDDPRDFGCQDESQGKHPRARGAEPDSRSHDPQERLNGGVTAASALLARPSQRFHSGGGAHCGHGHEGRLVQGSITEILTEATTAEIALWTITFSIVLLASSVIAQWSVRRRGDRRGEDWILAALRLAAVIAMFVILSEEVGRSGWLAGADASTLVWLVGHRTVIWTAAAVAVTTCGGPTGVAVAATVISAIWSWRWRSLLPAVVIVGTVAVAAGANTLTKLEVDRARPPVSAHLVAETDLSYPSGHAVGTVALAGAMLILYLPAARSQLRRVAALVAAAVAAAVVAMSRLYLGVHWLSDVVGGALLGMSVVLASALLVAVLDARAASTAADAEPEPDRRTAGCHHRRHLHRWTLASRRRVSRGGESA